MRDLAADLAICDKASPGPWKWVADTFWSDDVLITSQLFVREDDEKTDEDAFRIASYICEHENEFPSEENAAFIAAAREGWPDSINRTVAAEAEVESLKARILVLQGVIASNFDFGLDQYEAASIMNVTPLWWVEELNKGEVPYQMKCGRYFVKFDDLLEWDRLLKDKRLASLEELSKLDQELGLYP